MMPHDSQSHSEGSHVGELVPGPWVRPEARPNTPAAQQPNAPAVPSTEVAPLAPRRATRSRVLHSSQVIVGRVRVVATSPTTRERARRLRRRLVDEVRLIGQGVHMVARRASLEGQLRHFYEGNNPNGRVRADQVSEYRKERAELLKYRDEHRAGRYARYGLAGAGVVAEGGWIASLVGLLPSGHVAIDLVMIGANLAAGVKLRTEGKRLRAETAGVVEQRAATGDVQSTTADDIAAMLRDAGVLPSSTTTATEAGLALLAPPTTLPDGQGWEVRVMLPPGVVVGKIKKNLERLAGALDTSPAKITVNKIDESEGRARIRVWSHYPMSGMGAPSPLLSAPRWSLDDGIPFGRDIDGNPITLDLAGGMHGLMCAGSGGGKSFTARLLALATVLDPTAELHVVDGKPDGAWRYYRELCATYREVLDEDDLAAAADALESIVDRLRERMTRKAGGEQLGWAVVIVDEFQELTGRLSGPGMKPDMPRPRIRAALERISRLGRSAKVRLVLATQQFDGQTLDPGTEASLLWRWVGSVPDPEMSKEALGARAARLGIDASRDIVPGEQVGVGYLVAPGLGTVPPLVKSDFASDEDIEAVCARLLAEKGGTAPASASAVDEHQERDHDDEVIDVEIDREADLMETLASWLVAEHVDDDKGIPTGKLWVDVVQPYAASVWPDTPASELPAFVRSLRGFGDWLAKNGVQKTGGRNPTRRAGDIYEAAARMVGGNVADDDDQQFPGELRAVR